MNNLNIIRNTSITECILSNECEHKIVDGNMKRILEVLFICIYSSGCMFIVLYSVSLLLLVCILALYNKGDQKLSIPQVLSST